MKEKCSICYENNEKLLKVCNCKSKVHEDCIIKWINTSGNKICKVCTQEYNQEIIETARIRRPLIPPIYFQYIKEFTIILSIILLFFAPFFIMIILYENSEKIGQVPFYSFTYFFVFMVLLFIFTNVKLSDEIIRDFNDNVFVQFIKSLDRYQILFVLIFFVVYSFVDDYFDNELNNITYWIFGILFPGIEIKRIN